MYPTRLNLLSPNKKSHLKRMSHFQFTKSIFEILLITASVLAMILLGSQMVLQNYFATLTENIVSINNEHREEIREILRINKLLDETHTIQKNFIAWTPYIVTLSSSLPDGVILNSLSFDKKEKKIVITGQADTRETFLQLQEKLATVPFLSNVKLPVSDLTKRENIGFNISANLE
ncbi:MAG TPA: hypothetical protein DCS29_04715 [Candidatus Magasanikbacteria bacterium]|nr:MAG: hypothetical protein A2479_04065 [Candidatus Magasanikbacteria bacterium RIFOXYC2_FULL_39_8]HAT04042.1 hypothetical protein [Candidatus Magasanikbacteria bacterium]